jgi:hypothetical protein
MIILSTILALFGRAGIELMISPFASSIRVTSLDAHKAVGDRKGPGRAANWHAVCMCMCLGLQLFSRSELGLNQARRTRQLFLGDGRASQTRQAGWFYA